MGSDLKPGMIRQYRAIVVETGNGGPLLRVPGDFDESQVEAIKFIFGAPELRLQVVETAAWEREARELLPGLEARLTRVTYRVCPSFEPARTAEVAFDERRGTYQVRLSLVGDKEGQWEDIEDQEAIEEVLTALLRLSIPLNLGYVTGFDGTNYTLNIEQGFNGVGLSWWSGSVCLPKPVLRLTGLLDQWLARRLTAAAGDASAGPGPQASIVP